MVTDVGRVPLTRAGRVWRSPPLRTKRCRKIAGEKTTVPGNGRHSFLARSVIEPSAHLSRSSEDTSPGKSSAMSRPKCAPSPDRAYTHRRVETTETYPAGRQRTAKAPRCEPASMESDRTARRRSCRGSRSITFTRASFAHDQTSERRPPSAPMNESQRFACCKPSARPRYGPNDETRGGGRRIAVRPRILGEAGSLPMTIRL